MSKVSINERLVTKALRAVENAQDFLLVGDHASGWRTVVVTLAEARGYLCTLEQWYREGNPPTPLDEGDDSPGENVSDIPF